VADKEVVISFSQALDVVHPSIHCHDSIVTPIDGGMEIRDFIAALETAPEVMPAEVRRRPSSSCRYHLRRGRLPLFAPLRPTPANHHRSHDRWHPMNQEIGRAHV